MTSNLYVRQSKTAVSRVIEDMGLKVGGQVTVPVGCKQSINVQVQLPSEGHCGPLFLLIGYCHAVGGMLSARTQSLPSVSSRYLGGRYST